MIGTRIGGEQQHHDRALHEHAGDDQEAEDQEQHQDRVLRDPGDERGHVLRHLLHDDREAEHGREHEDEHDHADVGNRPAEHLRQLPNPELAVHEEAHHQGVDHREGAGLRRREEPEADPDDEPDGEGEGVLRLVQGAEHFPPSGRSSRPPR